MRVELDTLKRRNAEQRRTERERQEDEKSKETQVRLYDAQSRRNRRIVENFRKLLQEMRQKEGSSGAGVGEYDAAKFAEEVGREKEAITKKLDMNDPRIHFVNVSECLSMNVIPTVRKGSHCARLQECTGPSGISRGANSCRQFITRIRA